MTAVRDSQAPTDLVSSLLAGRAPLSEAELAQICAEEREALARDAAVTAYLDIFVARNVQQRLRAMALTVDA